jgi:hypothetical protein
MKTIRGSTELAGVAAALPECAAFFTPQRERHDDTREAPPAAPFF